jgi:predicted GNAT superfamily acetyltransferase
MPSDRLVVTWPLESERVAERLLSGYQPLAPGALDDLPDYGSSAGERAHLAIPSDIDTLLARDPARAREWHLRVRAALQDAFARGYAITGFAGDRSAPVGHYLLDRGDTALHERAGNSGIKGSGAEETPR